MGSRPYQRLISQNGRCPLLREFVTVGILFEIPNSRCYDSFNCPGLVPHPRGAGVHPAREDGHHHIHPCIRGR